MSHRTSPSAESSLFATAYFDYNNSVKKNTDSLDKITSHLIDCQIVHPQTIYICDGLFVIEPNGHVLTNTTVPSLGVIESSGEN